MTRHGRLAGWWVALSVLAMGSAATRHAADVTGKLIVTDKGGKRARDAGDAVVWLEGARRPALPVRIEIATEKKTFLPRVVVVPVGSTVSFPNHDPFKHNVFSLSEAASFDLGLYGRSETRTATFPMPGIVRVYCNVHAQMSAIVVVRDGPFFTQPGPDGGFAMAGVPPGRYLLHAWHERGGETSRAVEVTDAGAAGIELELDASGFVFKPHMNKFGKPYDAEGRRY